MLASLGNKLNNVATAGNNGEMVFKENEKIFWAEKKTEEEVLSKTNTDGSLINSIMKKHAKFFVPTKRSGKLEHLITTGKFNGEKARGQQRGKISVGLSSSLKTSGIKATIRATEYKMK
ncbi:hypothetical protein PoB_003220900 [Plakobranchus ocellatus]|uniref:Uncharacterized protein n=1 Tax=Plakobranchus ocellatus TaxID=259542 RepID=A0AAV4ADI8_9GAST|nr:hypothetical protein PoB_003220900 [Plakobranchus ocellatus]